MFRAHAKSLQKKGSVERDRGYKTGVDAESQKKETEKERLRQLASEHTKVGQTFDDRADKTLQHAEKLYPKSRFQEDAKKADDKKRADEKAANQEKIQARIAQFGGSSGKK